MCHSSPHMLICRGLGGVNGEEHDGEHRGGGILLWIPLLSFFGWTLWAHMSLSSWVSNVTPDKPSSSSSSLFLCSMESHSPNFKCCTRYASRPLDADEDGMYAFDIWLELQHTMWVGCRQVCLKLFSANLSRSNQFVATEIGRRLGWRRKDSQKVFDHVWYAQVPVILHPFKKEILKTKCFQRTEGFPSFSSAVIYKETDNSFFPCSVDSVIS